MAGYTTGSLTRLFDLVEHDVTAHIKDVVTTLHEELMAATPVWSGAAVANWQATDGVPNNSVVKHSESGPTGATNAEQMPLGSEPRRPANEAIARQSMAAVDFTKPKPVYTLFNNVEHSIALEYGELPIQGKPRTPALGITQTAIQATLRKVK